MTDKTVSLPETPKHSGFIKNNLRNYGMLMSLVAISRACAASVQKTTKSRDMRGSTRTPPARTRSGGGWRAKPGGRPAVGSTCDQSTETGRGGSMMRRVVRSGHISRARVSNTYSMLRGSVVPARCDVSRHR